PRFNIFVLCAIVFSESEYYVFDSAIKKLKIKHFGNENVVFHSTEMRKNKNAFKIFQDKAILQNFYKDIDEIFTKQNYKIIACIVKKEEYKRRYPKRNTAYEDALTFICERAMSYLGKGHKPNTLHFCLEKRGNKKDALLKKIYNQIIKYGTEFKSTNDFTVCHPNLFFRGKHQNINGLQFSDLCAYPIARRELSPEKKQPTYELFEDKIYCNFLGIKDGHGLKYFP
ncbi:MAG: DUF3800 domain-containing protein, partial [Bacteroidia bacterium]|nr:DUF3800 domain-containing protein [Bacteroidia bacterium]